MQKNFKQAIHILEKYGLNLDDNNAKNSGAIIKAHIQKLKAIALSLSDCVEINQVERGVNLFMKL